MQGLCASLLGPNSSSLVDELIVQYEVKEHLDISRLAEDTEQMPALEMELTGVARLQHLSLLREQQEGSRGVSGAEMVEVGSTVENLVQVAGAVAIGQPVLLVGEAGVGKTSLVRELAGRTGKELLTLQVGFSFFRLQSNRHFIHRSVTTQIPASWLGCTDAQSYQGNLSGRQACSHELLQEELGC